MYAVAADTSVHLYDSSKLIQNRIFFYFFLYKAKYHSHIAS